MKPSTFAERLAYARWIHHGATGKPASNREIGDAVGRTGPWVTKWAESDTPPRDYEVHEPLGAFLGVDPEWLIKDKGAPPRPELWDAWLKQRRRPVTKVPPVTNEAPKSGGKKNVGGA